MRYFGGTKLGVSGLIEAYKTSAAEVIAAANVVERTVDDRIEVRFSYMAMNEVMRVIKDMQPKIVEQYFDNLCTMTLTIRQSQSEQLLSRLSKVEGAQAEITTNN